MRVRTKINSFLSLLAAGLLTIFGRSPAKPTTNDLNRMEFKSSTQRLGIRFTERIREVFRFRWIKVSDKTNTRHYRHSERSEESHRSG
ncbi:MAG: hypothetical protein ABIL62_05260 [Planctomycetota bacterium]